MDNTPRQVLKELIATHGPALADNPQRCKGMLLDRCQAQKPEVNLLTQALEEQVPADLWQISTGTPYSILQARLVKRLHDNKGTTEEYARWAIDSWALALDVIQKEPVEQKTPPPPPPPSERPERQAILETPGLTATQVQTGPTAPNQTALQGQIRVALPTNRVRTGLIYGLASGVLAAIIVPILYNLYSQTQAYGLIGAVDVCALSIAVIAVGILPARASGSVLSTAIAGGLLGIGVFLGSIIGDSTDLIQGGVWIGPLVVFGGGILVISLLFGLLGRYLYRRSHTSS